MLPKLIHYGIFFSASSARLRILWTLPYGDRIRALSKAVGSLEKTIGRGVGDQAAVVEPPHKPDRKYRQMELKFRDRDRPVGMPPDAHAANRPLTDR